MSYISQTEKTRMYKQLNQFNYEELYLGIDEDCQKIQSAYYMRIYISKQYIPSGHCQ